MRELSIFDIMGPIMVGPSSSHTAGAVRLGLFVRNYIGDFDSLKSFYITFYNSFSQTSEGHGTRLGFLGGLLGYSVDDERIKTSDEELRKRKTKINYAFEMDSRKPDNAVLFEWEKNKKKELILGESIGGGLISIRMIDDFPVNLSASLPTVLIRNKDEKGVIAHMAAEFSKGGINIANMSVSRTKKGGSVLSIMELDEEPHLDELEHLGNLEAILFYRLIPSLSAGRKSM